jgi:hypothetical protein
MAIISIPTSINGVSIPGEAGRIASGPLSALYGGKGVTTISYPQELATDSTKNHYVQFSIKEIIPQSIEKIAQQLDPITKGAGQVFTDAAKATQEAAQKLADDPLGAVQNAYTNITKVTLDDTLALGSKTVQALGSLAAKADTSIRSLVKPKTTETKAFVSLYMPDTLESSYTANYNEISLTDELKTINYIRQIGQIATNAGESVSSGGTAFGAASSDPNVIATAIGAALGGLERLGISAGGNLDEVLLQGQGYASNPQLQMIYRGTGFRTFSLSFTFTPKSQAEAQIVNNIIYQFKYYAAPAIAQGKTNSSESMFLIPPAIFNVNFFFKDVDNKYLPKFSI